VRRQELRLAEFARPGADHLGRREIAALDDLQRRDGLVLEHLGAAAVIGQRHQRGQRRQIAHVGAEVALQSPERGDHRRRHAVFLLGARKRGGVGLDALLALLHAVGRRHAARELGEDLAEHALAAVAVDDALVVDEVGRRRRQGPLRHAFVHRALLEVGEEFVKGRAAMARRRARRCGGCPRWRGCAGRRGRGHSGGGRPCRRRLLEQLRGRGGREQQHGRHGRHGRQS
jgi:hypothetical protein